MRRPFLIIMTLAFAAAPAMAQDSEAITVRLDKMTNDDWVAIQRGNLVSTSQCIQDVLADAKSRKIPKRETFVTFEDPNTNGVTIGFADTDSSYTCEENEMRSYEEDGYIVVKRYK